MEKKGGSGSGSGGSDEVSMSIEETNKMRISLGLKPLKQDDPKEKEKEKAAKEQQKQEAEKQRRILEIGGNIEKLKKKRQLTEKLGGQSLGQALAGEDEGVAAWIRKSRTIQQEKELALKRAQELDQQDQQNESYSSNELKGLKVAHDLQQFQDTEGEIILTLKDTTVLKGSDLNEDDVELESIKFSELEKAKKNEQLRKKKPIYDKYDDTKKDILPQYNDEPKGPEGFFLSDNGAVKEGPDKELEEIRKKLQSEGKTLYSLDVTKTVANEYLPQQEVKFKKAIVKKKKLRKKETLELTPLADDPARASDHGSRKDASARMKADAQNQHEQERREKSYARALEKAAEDTKALFQEEEEDDLYKSVTRARETSTKKKQSVEEIVQRVQQTKNRDRTSDFSDNSVTFTATTEFIRAVQPDEPSKKKVVEDNPQSPEDKMNVDDSLSNEADEHQKMLMAQLEKENAKPKRTRTKEAKEADADSDEDDEEVRVIYHACSNSPQSDEPVASTLAATLKLIQSKGGVEDLQVYAGRKTDKKSAFQSRPDTAPSVNIQYLDENGQQMTPKEAFRKLSHKFHGKKPGKNKQEKRQKQIQEELRRRNMSTTDTPLMTVQAMQQEQERTQSPYIVLTGSGAGVSRMIPSPLTAPQATTSTPAASVSPVREPPKPAPVNVPLPTSMQGSFHEFKIETSKKQKLK